MRKPRQDVQDLWQSYFENRESSRRNALVEHYTHLAHIQAARLSRRLPNQIYYDEICSAAYSGLIEAVEKYDPQHNTKFETFCQQRVVGAVLDWLRSLDTQSRTVRMFERQHVNARETLDAELGRAPTQDEIVERMGVSRDRYNQLARISQMGKEVHFSAMDARASSALSDRGSERSWDLGDTKQPDPSHKISQAMLTDFITRGLSRDERLVLIFYYYEDLTMAEIGTVLELSESRVSQIHKNVLAQLRIRFKADTEQEQLVA